MMVVVQFLAADEDPPGDDVGARVGDVIAAIAKEVADAVDHARCPERDPRDLRQPDQDTGHHSEEQQVYRERREHAEDRVPGVEVTLHPVVRRTVSIALQRFLVERLFHIQETLERYGHGTPDDWMERNL